MQQKRERQIEKKKFEDALQLTIFNEEQKEEVQQELIEEQKRKQVEARRLLEKEQLMQSEQFRKRLAEKRNKNRNSPGETLNLTTSNFINNYGAEKIDSPYSP